MDGKTETPTYFAEQVRTAEEPLLAAGEPLMDIAANALAQVAGAALEDSAEQPRLLVLAGSGNNGGDALFAAAQLAQHVDVDVLLTSSRCHQAGFTAARDAGAHVIGLSDLTSRLSDENDAASYALVLDGILGIGTAVDPALRGIAREAVEALLPAAREGRIRAIAVDLPSGLHPDTGTSDGVVLPAALTVTFGAVKHGLVTGRGPEFAGDIILVPIGLEKRLAEMTPIGRALVDRFADE